MSFFSEEQGSELKELFFESARELMQALNEEGLQLEQHPGDAEIIRRVRRTVHTLKGDSAACGYRELSQLAHELEDVLTPELGKTANGSLAELVLSAAARSGQFSSIPIATSKTFWPAEAALAMTICSYSDQAKPPIARVAPLRRSNGA